MIDFLKFTTDASIMIALATFFLLALVLYNPRLMLQDYPPAIQSAVAPKSEKEKRQSLYLGLPFLLVLLAYPFLAAYRLGDAAFGELFLYSFGLVWSFNIWDWLVLDWLIFCTITPRQFVIPGSEGNPAYKDYAFHFRGFLIGTVFSIVLGLIVAVFISVVR